MVTTFFIFGAKYLYLVAGIIALIWFGTLPKNKKREVTLFGIIALPAIYIAAKLAGWLYVDPRPFVVGHFTPLIPHEPDNGFPSDHTLLLAAMASIIYPFNKRVSSAVWVIAAIVGIARVYVGIHHLVDVMGSILIAMGVSALVFVIIKKYKNRPIGRTRR